MKDTVKHIVSSEQMIKQCVRDMQTMLADHGYFNFEIKRGQRSLSQNALYWAWIAEIAEYLNKHNGTDFTSDEIHLRMKHDFLGYEPEKKIGSVTVGTRLRSTSKLTKGEMFHYMEKLDAWAAGVGILLHRPSDCMYEELRQRQIK